MRRTTMWCYSLVVHVELKVLVLMRNHELSTNGITVNYNHKTDLSRGPK